MDTSALYSVIFSRLSTQHERVYKVKAPSTKTFPYVVFRLESVTDSYPSDDYYLNVDIYDDPNTAITVAEALGDKIDGDLNHKVIIDSGNNFHFEREQRQSVDLQELVGAYLVNIRYVVRAYFD